VRRILSTGSLLLVLTGAAWAMPSCADDGSPGPVDSGYVPDTSQAPPPLDSGVVDTTAGRPDAAVIDGSAPPDTSPPTPDAGNP
jgi:hypothetical protein